MLGFNKFNILLAIIYCDRHAHAQITAVKQMAFSEKLNFLSCQIKDL